MEKEIRRWNGEWVYGARKMRERAGESDLKAGHVRPINEYVRTYIGTFDRTRACAWVRHVFERT
jgi:hypothetical protein